MLSLGRPPLAESCDSSWACHATTVLICYRFHHLALVLHRCCVVECQSSAFKVPQLPLRCGTVSLTTRVLCVRSLMYPILQQNHPVHELATMRPRSTVHTRYMCYVLIGRLCLLCDLRFAASHKFNMRDPGSKLVQLGVVTAWCMAMHMLCLLSVNVCVAHTADGLLCHRVKLESGV